MVDEDVGKECNALANLFNFVINDIKNSYPAWDDVGKKAEALSIQLKQTIASLDQFLDALQRVSDFATNAKGATRDIGTSLTRICMRHRSIENRLKSVSSALIGRLVIPLREHIDDWKQRVANLDKDHSRELKKNKHDIRKRSSDTLRLRKKVRKGDSRMQPMLEEATNDVNSCYSNLLDNERHMCRSALVEQRAQFCNFVEWFKPVLELELGLLEEATHLRPLYELLIKQSTEPNSLPSSSEAVIHDAKGLEHTWTQQVTISPPCSPSSLGSRKSSYCSLSSADSSAFTGTFGVASSINNSSSSHYRNPQQLFSSANQVSSGTINGRFKASHDSGIASSQDVIYSTNSHDPATQPQPSQQQQQQYYAHHHPQQHNHYHQSMLLGSRKNTGVIISQQSTPSPSSSAATWPETMTVDDICDNNSAAMSSMTTDGVTPRAHTIGAGSFDDWKQQQQRSALTPATFVPPSGVAPQPTRPSTLTGLHHHEQQQRNNCDAKPPLPTACFRRPYAPGATPLMTPTPTIANHHQQQHSIRNSIPIIPDFNAVQPDQYVPQTIYADVCGSSTMRRTTVGVIDAAASGRQSRPQSFVGDNTEDMSRMLYATGIGGSTSSSSATVSAQDDEDTLIEQALGQIDQLGTDLDSYCTDSNGTGAMAYCTLPRRSTSSNEVHWRPPLHTIRSFDGVQQQQQQQHHSRPPSAASHISGVTTILYPLACWWFTASVADNAYASYHHQYQRKQPPPAPPIRRNSTITAATPTAPSVEQVRKSRCTTPVDHQDLPMPPPPPPYVNNNGGDNTVAYQQPLLMQQIRNGCNLRPTNRRANLK